MQVFSSILDRNRVEIDFNGDWTLFQIINSGDLLQCF